MIELKLEEARDFFANFYGGAHNIRQDIKRCGLGWQITHLDELSTFDSDQLTKLVIMAHALKIRVGVRFCNTTHGAIEITLHKRLEDGSIMERHPNLLYLSEVALKMHNKLDGKEVANG